MGHSGHRDCRDSGRRAHGSRARRRRNGPGRSRGRCRGRSRTCRKPGGQIQVTAAPIDERANSRNALIAGFLGWTLDAFDYFLLAYVLTDVGAEFHKSVSEMTLTIAASLVMRPVGAILFGLMADRYGRRLPLMLDVIFYSVIEVLSGLASSYNTFLILR